MGKIFFLSSRMTFFETRMALCAEWEASSACMNNYSTSVAYNTERRRGAYISNVDLRTPWLDTLGHGNQVNTKAVHALRSTASKALMAVVESLMRHSVAQLQNALVSGGW